MTKNILIFAALAGLLAGGVLSAASDVNSTPAAPANEPELVAPEGDTLEKPAPVRVVTPAYPPQLVRHRIEGVVELTFVVESDGSVRDVTANEAANSRLAREARLAVNRWVFRPALLNGEAVPITVRMPVRFVIEGDEKPYIGELKPVSLLDR